MRRLLHHSQGLGSFGNKGLAAGRVPTAGASRPPTATTGTLCSGLSRLVQLPSFNRMTKSDQGKLIVIWEETLGGKDEALFAKDEALLAAKDDVIAAKDQVLVATRRLESLRTIFMNSEQLSVQFFLEAVKNEINAQLTKKLNLTDALEYEHLRNTSTQDSPPQSFDDVVERLRGTYTAKDVCSAISGLRRFHAHHHQHLTILKLVESGELVPQQEKVGLQVLATIIGGQIQFQSE